MKTGQIFEAKNNATIVHNVKWSGDRNVRANSKTLPPGDSINITDQVKPSYNKPVVIQCDIHPWMNAHAWVLEHPFAAVTDKDGKYHITNAPAGAKVRVVVWHEAKGFIGEGGKDGKVVTLKKGDNTEDFKITK
jgi:hypothetical protein